MGSPHGKGHRRSHQMMRPKPYPSSTAAPISTTSRASPVLGYRTITESPTVRAEKPGRTRKSRATRSPLEVGPGEQQLVALEEPPGPVHHRSEQQLGIRRGRDGVGGRLEDGGHAEPSDVRRGAARGDGELHRVRGDVDDPVPPAHHGVRLPLDDALHRHLDSLVPDDLLGPGHRPEGQGAGEGGGQQREEGFHGLWKSIPKSSTARRCQRKPYHA